jgi:hypothetical protein
VAIAAGQPVRSNIQGKLVLAQANSTGNARQVAVSEGSAAIGFTCRISRTFVTLDDWTAATGSVSLTPGADYFLDAAVAGRLVTAPPLATGNITLRIGTAVDARTLALTGGVPILQ